MGRGDSSLSVQLGFPTDASLRSVLEIALPACASPPVPEAAAERVAIIVEELLANLYDHSAMPAGGVVTLKLENTAEGVRLILENPGPPFDPRGAPTDAPMAERGGGAGLNLVRAWATILSYRSGPPINRLEVMIAVPARTG